MAGSDDGMVEAARSFLDAAWKVLLEQRVVPRPRFSPYLEVGHDYFGGELRELPEYKALSVAIEQAHPRFQEDVPFGERDFASGYIFSFIEAFVADMSLSHEEFSPTGPAAERAVECLARAIDSSNAEVACCRVVSHMTTSDGAPREIAGIRVVPLVAEPSGHSRELISILEENLPRVAEVHRFDLGTFASPGSVLIAREVSAKPHELASTLATRIERFLFIARLLRAGTCDSAYELQGETAAVRRSNPSVVRFRGHSTEFEPPTGMLRRTVCLSHEDGRRFDGLSGLIDLLEDRNPDSIVSSFRMAVRKFQASYHADAWYDQLVDLATAFEATFSGISTADVTLRLRTRSAALLWTENDPASAIFDDVGHLYGIRSKLVHGGSLTEKALRKVVYSISTVPAEAPFGLALAYVVDRLRDLVRRSLLVRMSLAGGDEPRWRLGDDSGVDSQLAGDAVKHQWRSISRDVLASMDAGAALERPKAAISSLRDEVSEESGATMSAKAGRTSDDGEA